MHKYQLEVLDGSFLGKPEEHGINVAERTYQRKLTPEYLEFLNYYNGVILSPSAKISTPSGEVIYLERFLAILGKLEGQGADYDISAFINNTSAFFIDENYDDEDPFYDYEGPEEYPFIPFAVCSNDDTLCFDYREDPAAPQIVQWLKRESKDFAPVTEPFADSFDECLRIMAAAQQKA